MKKTNTLITLLSFLYGVHTYNPMLIFVSLVLALGISLHWIADTIADILQARRLEKSMESIVNILEKGLDLEKSIDEHNNLQIKGNVTQPTVTSLSNLTMSNGHGFLAKKTDKGAVEFEPYELEIVTSALPKDFVEAFTTENYLNKQIKCLGKVGDVISFNKINRIYTVRFTDNKSNVYYEYTPLQIKNLLFAKKKVTNIKK